MNLITLFVVITMTINDTASTSFAGRQSKCNGGWFEDWGMELNKDLGRGAGGERSPPSPLPLPPHCLNAVSGLFEIEFVAGNMEEVDGRPSAGDVKGQTLRWSLRSSKAVQGTVRKSMRLRKRRRIKPLSCSTLPLPEAQ